MIIINIGNELLYGKTINTNASFLSEKLYHAGYEVNKILIIQDEREAIISTLSAAFEETDIVLMTGGLGPTNDDITKAVIAAFFDTYFILDNQVLQQITEMFAAHGIEVNELNRQQAEIPFGAQAIPNPNGTAPGIWIEKQGQLLVAMPGVPFEMKAMFENHVLPQLKEKKPSSSIILHHEILTSGIAESALAEKIADWEKALPAPLTLAYLPSPGKIQLRLTAKGNQNRQEFLETSLKTESDKLKNVIAPYIVSTQNETVEEIVARLLKKTGKKLAVAESCTGGYISHLITSLPGSSSYFQGSIVAYSNDVKREILNVREGNLRKEGAVSEFVVNDMAINTMGLFDVDYTIATSGIAGPLGGTPAKPVGTVWIAVATPTRIKAQKFSFGSAGGREVIIKRATYAALNMLRIELLKDQ